MIPVGSTFPADTRGYDPDMANQQIVTGGQTDQAAHAAHADLDAPMPPGGPLRQDRPDAEVNPVASVDPVPSPPDPDVVPSSTPGGPSIIPTPGTPEGEPGPDPAPDPQQRSEQLENAGTSLDQPSDGSGSA